MEKVGQVRNFRRGVLLSTSGMLGIITLLLFLTAFPRYTFAIPQPIPGIDGVHPVRGQDGIYPRQATPTSTAATRTRSAATTATVPLHTLVSANSTSFNGTSTNSTSNSNSTITITTPAAVGTPTAINGTVIPIHNIETCGFGGDDNMYGLGIRIGYYIQWVATVAGSLFSDEDFVSAAFQANAIFNIGMLAGLLYSTITRPQLYAVEPLIVLGFSIGGFIVGLLDPKNAHRANNLRSLRKRLVFLLGTATSAIPVVVYWTWYAWYGVDKFYYTNCSSYAFMIVRINILRVWYRIFLKVATAAAVVGFLALAVVTIILYRIKLSEIRDEQGTNQAQDPNQGKNLRRPKVPASRYFIVIVALGLCAASVEFGIIWNRIDGVNNDLGSTGQLIPLVMGIVTSLQVLGMIVRHKWKKSHKLRKHVKQHKVLANVVDLVVTDVHKQPNDLPPSPNTAHPDPLIVANNDPAAVERHEHENEKDNISPIIEAILPSEKEEWPKRQGHHEGKI